MFLIKLYLNIIKIADLATTASDLIFFLIDSVVSGLLRAPLLSVVLVERWPKHRVMPMHNGELLKANWMRRIWL